MKSLSLRGSVAARNHLPQEEVETGGEEAGFRSSCGDPATISDRFRDKSCDSLKLPASGESAGPLGTCRKGNEDAKPSAGTPAPARSPGHAARTRLHSDQTSIEPGVHDTLARDCESWSRHPERRAIPAASWDTGRTE